MPDVRCEFLKAAGKHSQRREVGGVPVARDHLSRHGRDLEAQLCQGSFFDPGIDRGMRPHRAGQLAHSDVFPGGDQPLAVTVQLVQPAGEHKPEAQRLGMDAVGPAGHQRPAFLDRTAPDHGGNPIEVVEQDVGGADQLQRQRRIEDVGGSQAPVQVTGVVSHRLGQRVQESHHIMPNPLLQPGDVIGIDSRLPEALDRRFGDLSDLGPTLGHDEFDPQPQFVALLWGEDLAHLRVSVSGDQTAAGLLLGGGPSVTG